MEKNCKDEPSNTQLLWKFLLTDQTYKAVSLRARVFKPQIAGNQVGIGITLRILQFISLL